VENRRPFDLTTDNLNDPSGWTVTSRMRVVDHDKSPQSTYNGAVSLFVYDGSDRFWLDFTGTDPTPSENGIWSLLSAGWTQLYQMDTASAYHDYQLVYDPAQSDRVGLYVDGDWVNDILRSAASNTSNRSMAFGSASSADMGRSNWSYVAFEGGQHVVPEPSTLVLLACGCGMLLLRRRRHKR